MFCCNLSHLVTNQSRALMSSAEEPRPARVPLPSRCLFLLITPALFEAGWSRPPLHQRGPRRTFQSSPTWRPGCQIWIRRRWNEGRGRSGRKRLTLQVGADHMTVTQAFIEGPDPSAFHSPSSCWRHAGRRGAQLHSGGGVFCTSVRSVLHEPPRLFTAAIQK